MYDEGRDVDAFTYREKTSDVRVLAAPIFSRMNEGPGGVRAAAVEAARKTVGEVCVCVCVCVCGCVIRMREGKERVLMMCHMSRGVCGCVFVSVLRLTLNIH
jgi:hypothetical protein